MCFIQQQTTEFFHFRPVAISKKIEFFSFCAKQIDLVCSRQAVTVLSVHF
jgi:hypothetical protein